MKNRRTPLLLALTALALLLCALLPGIAAFFQDRAGARSCAAPLQPQAERQTEQLPMVQKLSALGRMSVIPIDPSQASMTTEEVLETVRTRMAEYEAAGIFSWFEVTQHSAVPKLGLDPENTDNMLIHWTVSFVNTTDPSRSLVLDLDDETGQILSISYSVYDSYTMDGVWKRNRSVMQKLTELYFSQLGLAELRSQAEATEGGVSYYERDGGVSSAVYTVTDERTGEFSLEFFVDGAGGFSIYFPS